MSLTSAAKRVRAYAAHVVRRYQDDRELQARLASILPRDVVVLDCGARNGCIELPRIAPFVRAYGFEPNLAEHETLMRLADEPGRPAYAHLEYSPKALLAEAGTAMLYVSRRPGATSTLRPNVSLLRHFQRDNFSQLADIVETTSVEGITVSQFLHERGIDYVDYIKLDTQGNELDILRSSGPYLTRLSVVKCEVETVPLYEGQPLLGDVCVTMAAAGFHLIDLQWTSPCRRFHFNPRLPWSEYQLVWADAIFAYQPFEFENPRKLQQALVLAELGYADLALYMMENLPGLAPRDREWLLSFYQRPQLPSTSSPLRNLAHRILPLRAARGLRAAREWEDTKQVTRL